jgi:hypothetical protein
MLPALTVPATDSAKPTVETLIDVLRLILAVKQTARAVFLIPTSFSLANLQKCRRSRSRCLASARYETTGRRWPWRYTPVLFDAV